MIKNYSAGIVMPRLQRWSIYFALFTAVIALSVLAGWQGNIALLKRPIPGLVAMNPLTALGFLLSSLCFLSQAPGGKTSGRNTAAKGLAVLVLIIGLTCLAGDLFPALPAADHLLFARRLVIDETGNISNRMAINTAICFMLLAPSLLQSATAPRKRSIIADLLVLAVFLLSLLPLIGYLYRVKEFEGILRRFPMAIHTAVCFLSLSLACLFARGTRGVIREFTGPLTGSLTARRLLPFAIFVPILLGLLRLAAYWKGGMSVELGVALLIFSLIVCFLALIWYNAWLLNRRDLLKQQAEKEWQASESRWKLLVSSVKDYAILLLDPKGRVLTWNAGAQAIKGYSQNEIIGRPVTIFYTPEQIESGEPRRNLEMAERLGRHYSEGWRVRKDGTRFWAEIVFTALYSEDHQLQAFVKITRDMTEQKIAREKIAYQARLIEDSSDAMLSTDTAFRIVSWNKAAQGLYGYSAQEAVGVVFGELLRNQTDERVRHTIREELREKGYWRGEVVVITKKNEALDIALSMSATHDDKDVLNGYVIVCRDMTERVRAETRLQQFNQLLEQQVNEKTAELREIFERVTDAFIAFDRDGNVVYINSRAEEIYRNRGLDILGKNIWAGGAPTVNSTFAEHFRRAMALQQDQHYEIYSTALGLWLECHMYPSPNGLSQFFRDITEQRQVQQQLETSNEELRALASHLQDIREEERAAIAREVHDQLGQQLTGLKMDLSWIGKKLQTGDTSGSQKKIGTTIQLLDDTIRTVRKIATELRPGILDDLGLPAAIEWQSQEFQKRSGIRAVFRTNITEPGIDPSQAIGLFRICQEALTNVARHSEAKNVFITLKKEANRLLLQIADDGKGIAPDRRDAPKTLGILGMKERAIMMGGRLEMASQAGEGLTLAVTVPLPDTHEQLNL